MGACSSAKNAKTISLATICDKPKYLKAMEQRKDIL